MIRLPFDIWDDRPYAMRQYLKHYGWHFNRKACEAAARMMRRMDAGTSRIVDIQPYSKEEVDAMMERYGLTLDNDVMYDAVFVANMAKADFLGSSLEDEQHLALYVKDTVDDVDVADGVIMRRWYATAIANGDAVDWEELL